MELHSLATMRSPLLEGPHQRRRYRNPWRNPWPLLAALVVLVLVGLAVRHRRAHGSSCPAGRCERGSR